MIDVEKQRLDKEVPLTDLEILPKDHGWSWVCLFAGFLIQVITIGIGLRTFGVIYEEVQHKFSVSSGAVSWIPAIYCSMLFFNGVTSNALARKFGTRPVVFCGGIIHASGMFLSCFAWRVECLYFTYGFLGGIGTSLAFSPSVVAVSQHFRIKQALAIGIAFSGNGVGAFTFAPLIRAVVDAYHLNGAFLLMASTSLHICALGLLFRPPSFYRRTSGRSPTAKGAESAVKWGVARAVQMTVSTPDVVPLSDITASTIITTVSMTIPDKKDEATSDTRCHILNNPLLLLYALCLGVADSSFSNIFNMLPSHTNQIGISSTNSAWLISIIGLADLISRVLTGWFADLNVIPKRLIFQSSIFLCGLTFCVAPMLKSYLLLAINCAIMSFAAGSFVALAPVLLTEAVGVANMSSAYGVMNFFGGLPFLVSPAIVSSLYDVTGSWNESFLLCGVMLFVAAIANIIGARLFHTNDTSLSNTLLEIDVIDVGMVTAAQSKADEARAEQK